jgi:hypothetical protein
MECERHNRSLAIAGDDLASGDPRIVFMVKLGQALPKAHKKSIKWSPRRREILGRRLA